VAGPFSQGAGADSASFSCIFLRAAKIISSLRRCSIFCLASLLLAHPGAGASSSLSLPLELSLDCRLYRVIKSGGNVFEMFAVGVVVDGSAGESMNAGGG
jgi:hypothetical protein